MPGKSAENVTAVPSQGQALTSRQSGGPSLASAALAYVTGALFERSAFRVRFICPLRRQRLRTLRGSTPWHTSHILAKASALLTALNSKHRRNTFRTPLLPLPAKAHTSTSFGHAVKKPWEAAAGVEDAPACLGAASGTPSAGKSLAARELAPPASEE